jgi:hypothetical protein
MNPAARRRCLPLSALLLSPWTAVAEPAPTALPAVQVQAARVPGIDPFALPASQDTVWIDASRAGTGAQLSEALAGVPDCWHVTGRTSPRTRSCRSVASARARPSACAGCGC